MNDAIQRSSLGRHTEYVDHYDPALLYPIPRAQARATLQLPEPLPFHGEDFWTAYELSWCDRGGKPQVAMARFSVPCDSVNLIESKSLKLYLNSFANSRFANAEQVSMRISQDLSACAGAAVSVALADLQQAAAEPWLRLPDNCIDTLDFDAAKLHPSRPVAEQLQVLSGDPATQQFCSHLLRSLCPVTGQPDWATLIVSYHGVPLCLRSVLHYLVALRNHSGFHEQIIERIFADLLQLSPCASLTVYGRFTRRGGLDINPCRSNQNGALPFADLRTVRQ